MRITIPEVERIVLERGRMLTSIKRYLSENQFKAIQKKLEEEKHLMLGMVETEKRFQTVAKKSFLTLNQIYFKRKTIDNNIFE